MNSLLKTFFISTSFLPKPVVGVSLEAAARQKGVNIAELNEIDFDFLSGPVIKMPKPSFFSQSHREFTVFYGYRNHDHRDQAGVRFDLLWKFVKENGLSTDGFPWRILKVKGLRGWQAQWRQQTLQTWVDNLSQADRFKLFKYLNSIKYEKNGQARKQQENASSAAGAGPATPAKPTALYRGEAAYARVGKKHKLYGGSPNQHDGK